MKTPTSINHTSHLYTAQDHPLLATMNAGSRLQAHMRTVVFGVLLVIVSTASQGAEKRTLVIDDRLDGRTAGTVVGGKFVPEGYCPGAGGGHILYQLPDPVTNGFAEFEFKGFDAQAVPADADNGFFAMYDGRGIEEPIPYFDDFKQNFFRWNVHYRQNRGVIKAVLSCAAPTPENLGAAKAVFEKRDWSAEPDGRAFNFDKGKFHRMRIEWVGRQLRVLVDDQAVWNVESKHAYAPPRQRIWLGSAPGYTRDGKSKYLNTLPDLVYRNFKLGVMDAPVLPARAAELEVLMPNGLKPEAEPGQAPGIEKGPAVVASSEAAGPQKNAMATPVRFSRPWTSPYRVDPERPHHFVNAEGQHLFVMCKTAWAFFGCKDPQGYLERAKEQGINVIRVALEGRPYFKELGIDLWPWGGTRANPDFSTFNEPYWNEVERRIDMAGKMGIGINLVLYFTLRPPNEAAATQTTYWQRAIDRLGKYTNMFLWEIENENLKEPAFQDAAGTYFMENDPFGRPVCTSDGTTKDAAWPHKKWVGVAINHSCTGSGAAGGRDDKGKHTLDGWYLTAARNTRGHGKPAFCNESGREKRHKNDDAVHRRKQGWIWTTAGCYWNWHSWDGCEGIDDASYKAPGAEFVSAYAKFWTTLPFWTLAPNDQAIAVDGDGVIWTALADEEKSLLVAYLSVEKSGGKVSASALRLALPSGDYRVALLEPSYLEVLGERSLIISGGAPVEFKLPPWTDDLLVRISRAKRGQ